MSSTKSIFQETVNFAANLIHHEQKYNSSLYNIPNFNNPLVSNIEEVNDTFTVKEATIQPNRMDFVDAMSKEMGANEN